MAEMAATVQEVMRWRIADNADTADLAVMPVMGQMLLKQ